jgi:DinB superfamily
VGDRVWAERLEGWIAWNHEEVEASVGRVATDLVGVRPSSSAPSVAFHTWHIGRWVDRNLTSVSAWLGDDPATPEVWIAEGLAERWGLAGMALGDFGETGAGLDDAASASLALPDRDEILRYVGGTFREFERVLARIDDDTLERRVVDLYGDESTIGDVLLNHLSHADRHLGMIEALRGVLGERGTATV